MMCEANFRSVKPISEVKAGFHGCRFGRIVPGNENGLVAVAAKLQIHGAVAGRAQPEVLNINMLFSTCHSEQPPAPQIQERSSAFRVRAL
jgi:hypothetical protein